MQSYNKEVHFCCYHKKKTKKNNHADEAYEEDGTNCVVRQICALYRMERLDVEQEFDMINDMIPDPPRAEGISPLQILEWCRRNNKHG